MEIKELLCTEYITKIAMEGLSFDTPPVVQDTLCSDINKPKIVTTIEFAEVSNDSLNNSRNSSSSSEEETTVIRIKKRVQRFSDSVSGTDKENDKQEINNSVADDKINNLTNSNPRKSMAKYTLDKLDSDSSFSELETNKNEAQQSRIESKRNKIREKFRKLASKHKNNYDNDSHNESNNNSEDSDPDVSSVAKIKQIIKERLLVKPSICDPDTSEDDEVPQNKHKVKQKKQQKSVLTSPKPIRMSAKQAMENMHKIKSESNRLLREKEVSLPYHKPKALSLKDILNRRKPAFTSDGKVLPIKMNEEQLKEYVLLLEQRQKEIMELCKSETDEESDEKQAEKEKTTKESTAEVENDLKLLDKELLENNVVSKMETEEIISAINPSKKESTEENVTDKKNFEEVENHDIHTNMEMPNQKSEREIESANKNIITVNYSIKDNDNIKDKENDVGTEYDGEKQLLNADSKKDSQLISLYYDSEKSDMNSHIYENIEEIEKDGSGEFDNNDISENEIDFDDIDKIIENSKIIEAKNSNSTLPLKESLALKMQPKLTGSAGMVIDLDDSETPKKLTGLELLKERFTYFAKLKTSDELERQREKRLKPGTQHLKLKQELEEKIAEQRSIEWAKRFEEEKQQRMELKGLRGEISDAEDDIEKIEAKLEEDTIEPEESSSSEEEEVNEIKENAIRKKNPMIDDEAEVTDCEDDDTLLSEDLSNEDIDDKEGIDDGNIEEDDNESSDDESSESDNEKPVQKKGRILKAFVEDSDDENINVNDKVINTIASNNTMEEKEFDKVNKFDKGDENIDISQKESQVIKDTQDDPIQLAQRVISASDDLFTSQESGLLENKSDETFTGTQTFSILDSKLNEETTKINDTEKLGVTNNAQSYDNNTTLESQTYTENFIPSQITKTISSSQSQPFGEDILALCTGKFYDNEFITEANKNLITNNGTSGTLINNIIDLPKEPTLTNSESNRKDDGNILQSILEELHNTEIDSQKPNKYFISEQGNNINNSSVKKKFVIDSDEEGNDTSSKEQKKKKHFKKRKRETRVLQISDDEDDEQSYEEETYEYNSSDIEDETDKRKVEYDSEENEIEVKPQNNKKKHKAGDFFEEEAELTSEDEWVGSGDEDEADLDRMEREEGDDDVFHQGKLQKELGQIHMRDVLDQDKREVRLIQELLFEDGDLGDGHRQRKFRWKNADGEEETGMVVEGFTDTQEEEFESEELWRKQRHEREIFLRQMENQVDSPENANVSLNRTKIIKANLCSKTMSSLLLEVNSSNIEKIETTDVSVAKEKKNATNQSNPQKAFTIFQQYYHKSLLTRGQGALARLAALATPLAIDDDAPNIGSLGPSNRRNFVFTSITPDDKETKVPKRKADSKADTPRLVKKMKTDEKRPYNKNSLLNHLQI